MKMVMADLKKGALKDWGAFVAEHKGYAIVEGTELEVENGRKIHSTSHL
jgi:hypothetical protein